MFHTDIDDSFSVVSSYFRISADKHSPVNLLFSTLLPFQSRSLCLYNAAATRLFTLFRISTLSISIIVGN